MTTREVPLHADTGILETTLDVGDECQYKLWVIAVPRFRFVDTWPPIHLAVLGPRGGSKGTIWCTPEGIRHLIVVLEQALVVADSQGVEGEEETP